MDEDADSVFDGMQGGHLVQKAVACVVRPGPGSLELLVFRHPHADVQFPKGGIEAGEAPEVAVLRELREESGIEDVSIRAKIAEIPMRVPTGPGERGPLEDQLHHVFWLEPLSKLPASWDYSAEGSVEEAGLIFSFFWIPLAEASSALHPRYHRSVRALEEILSGSEPNRRPSRLEAESEGTEATREAIS